MDSEVLLSFQYAGPTAALRATLDELNRKKKVFNYSFLKVLALPDCAFSPSFPLAPPGRGWMASPHLKTPRLFCFPLQVSLFVKVSY